MKTAILVAGVVGFAISCFAQSQHEMNAEAAANAAKADRELNKVYKQLLATLDEEGVKLLKASQRAWIAFRDADAAAAADTAARGGSMAPMIYSGTIATLTDERTAALKERLGGPEGIIANPDAEPDVPEKPPVRKAEPLEEEPKPASKMSAGGREPAGAKTQSQAAQQFFDAYKAHDRSAAQAVAAEAALKKLVWKTSAGDNPTLKLMDTTHIYYEGGSIELKMQKNAAGRWVISDVSLYAD